MCRFLSKSLVVVALAAALSTQDLGAQGLRTSGGADSASTVDKLYPRLFEGIKLTPQQENKAKSLIWTTQQAQRDAARQPDGFDKIRALQATRDSALSTLLVGSEDRNKFEANASKMRPVPVQRP